MSRMSHLIRSILDRPQRDAVAARHSLNTGEWQGLDSLEQRLLMSASTIDLLPLGDSITAGFEFANSYRRPLQQLLEAGGYDNIDFVGTERNATSGPPINNDFDRDHEGHGGWRANEILQGHSQQPGEGSLPEWLQTYTPDIALIHLGTNDFVRNESVEGTIEEIEQIIQKIRDDNPNVTILLATLIPGERASTPDLQDKIDAFNAELPDVVNNLDTVQSRVILVDQANAVDPETDYVDGLHPNASGEAKMAQAWYDALKPVLDAISPAPEDGSIFGRVYNDLNSNGDKADSEPGIQGITVFLDQNNNGILDNGEKSTTTRASGSFQFDDLPGEATYYVRIIVPENFNLTTPATPTQTVALGSGENVDDLEWGIVQPGGDEHGDTKKEATKLGKLDLDPIIVNEMVGGDDTGDMFKVKLKKSGDLNVMLTGMQGDGADVRIFNRNGRQILAQSANDGSANETINANLKRGKYLIRVYKRPGGSNAQTNYALKLESGTNVNAETTSATNQTILEDILAEQIVPLGGGFDPTNIVDEYIFKTKGKNQINAVLTAATGNITVLLTNKNGRRVYAEGLSTGQSLNLSHIGGGKKYSLQIIDNTAGASTYAIDLNAVPV